MIPFTYPIIIFLQVHCNHLNKISIKIIRINHGTFQISYYYFTVSTFQSLKSDLNRIQSTSDKSIFFWSGFFAVHYDKVG